MKRFIEIIIDDKTNTLEVLNWSTDDRPLIDNVVKMQKVGMSVRCTTIDNEPLRDEIIIKGYSRIDGLYSRLINEYETKTGELLKRW